MAGALQPEESRDRAVSSEPCSTRPNPFDDSDVSSRKRRRTSHNSASRSRSVDTITSSPPSPFAGEVPAPALRSDSAMKVDSDLTISTIPTTPEPKPLDLDAEPPSALTSRHVTINVRTPSRLPGASPDSPLSPTLRADTPASPTNVVKLSIEDSELDMAQEDAALDTPVSSASERSSPPVEVIAIPPDDDGDFEDGASIAILDGNEQGPLGMDSIRDPSANFPFREDHDSWSDVVSKAASYFPNHIQVAQKLQEYIEDYLVFAENSSHRRFVISHIQYQELWQSLPEIVCFMTSRGFYPPQKEFRSEIFEFYKWFAKLTAFFVKKDALEFEKIASDEQGIRLRDLISPAYVSALAGLVRKKGQQDNCQRPEDEFYTELQQVIDCFQSYSSPSSGTLAHVLQLAKAEVERIPQFPKLADHVTSLCSLAAAVLSRYFLVHSHDSPQAAQRAKAIIARGYQFFLDMSSSLSTFVDKGPNHFSPENASTLLSALTETYQIALNVDDVVSREIIANFRRLHPFLVTPHLPEAIAHLWKFNIFVRLIKSGQMQLRVMSAHVMCNDLINMYRKYNEQGETPNMTTMRFYGDYLLQTGLVKYLLGPTCHPEIAAESSNIIGFLVVSRTYSNDHTDAWWHTVTTTQDTRISDALILMLNRITQLFLYEVLIHLCEKLNTVPADSFTEPMRILFVNITQNLMDKTRDHRIIADPPPYDLCTRLIRESSRFGPQSPVAHPSLQESAIKRFRELLSHGHGPTVDIRRSIMVDCLNDIAHPTWSAIGSLWVLHLLARNQIQQSFLLLAQDNDLPRLLVEELEAAIPAAHAAGFPAVISGAHNLPRRELLETLIKHKNGLVTKELGLKLWQLLVGPGASCRQDRDVAWELLLNAMEQSQVENRFTSVCFTDYLPTLEPEFFCQGTLDFVRARVLPLVNDPGSIVLDDDESVDHAGLELLWHIVLTAKPDSPVSNHAIRTLVRDVYVESKSILSFSYYRARKVHLGLVRRCLQQLSAAATRLKTFAHSGVSIDDADAMDVVPSDQEVQEQELVFVRSLSVLREFHRLHQEKPAFCAPDLQSLMLDSPRNVEGESAELKYQSFDENSQTPVQPLSIGKLNTTASLLASIREVTGFNNYRMYYRGAPFVPQENQICKSLEDLQIHNGLILVKKDSETAVSTRARPGASAVDVEILGHFEELWGYLSLGEKLAREIYVFLIKLPADEGILKAIDSPSLSFQDLFPVGQSFKSLYAVYALQKYIAARRKQSNTAKSHTDGEKGQEALRLYADSLTRAMSLVVPAISNDVAAHCPSRELRIELEMALLDMFVLLSTEPQLPEAAAQYLDEALLLRLLTNLSSALSGHPAPHVRRCFQSILEACCLSDSFMAAFCAQPEVPRLVERMLLHEPCSPIGKKAAALIRQKCGVDESSESRLTRTRATAFRKLFWPLVCGLVEPAVKNRSAEVLGLCLELFRAVRSAQPELLKLRDLSNQWFNLLAQYDTTEDVTKPHVVDQVATLLVRLLDTLISSCNGMQRKEVLPDVGGMGLELFWKHLFNTMDDGGQEMYDSGPPILTSHTRATLMSIILATLDAHPEDLQGILDAMHDLVALRVTAHDELYQFDLPQQFEREKAIRAPCGYQGLRNLSNTCYFNSLFTQLFMNHDFRRFMLGAKIRDHRYGQALLVQTQKVFAQMQGSIARSCNPEDCVASIKTYEDSQIDVGIQMDVDEFYNLLFDRWEGQFATPEEKNRFRSFYGGQLVQQVRSTECPHISERLEPFSAIQCDIKGNNSLAKSLEAYVKGEVMEGDNKYKCSTCDRHVNAVKRACLKDIPDNLIFHLKRFDFNLRTMQRSKINQHFEFPDKINMRPYTIDHLSNPSEGDGPEDIFELVGVLVHSGTAESGHYYSYIRERPSSSEQPTWVEFNDDVVSAWNPANLEHTCFGGPDYSVQYQSNGVQFDKQYSAYMLFYQRASSLATSQQKYLEQNKLSGPLRVPVPRPLGDSIEEENMTLLRRHCLFDPYQIQFVISAMMRLKAIHPVCTDSHTAEGSALWMAIGHLDQVASRIKDTPHFAELAARIQNMVQSCGLCAVSLNRYFYEYPEPLRVMLQRNIDGDIRQGAGRLVIRTLQTIKAQLPLEYGSAGAEVGEEDASEEGGPDVISTVLSVISQLWLNFHTNLRSWPEVFSFMLSFVRLGREELAGFLGHGHLESLLWIVAADPALGEHVLPGQIYKMAATISRRPHNRMPSYEAILALLDYVLAHVRLTERHDRTPYARQMPDSGSTFNMTNAEAKILWMEWPKYNYNIFVDRLITIGQNEEATHSILANLIKQSSQMEEAVCRTLRQAISGSSSHGSLVAPYLQVARQVFIRYASEPVLIKELIHHVSQQCKGLQSAEGKAFLDFQRTAYDGLREHSGEADEDVTMAGLDNMLEWVPSLLGYYDSTIGAAVEKFLQDKLFSYRTYNVQTEDIISEEDEEAEIGVAEKMNQTARALGLQCLYYLRDNYVLRNAEVSQHVVAGLQRVIHKCNKYFDLKNPAEDKLGQEFVELSNVILESVTKLTVVEELEEDGSDWENSSICSGQLDSFGVFAANPLQDVDLQ